MEIPITPEITAWIETSKAGIQKLPDGYRYADPGFQQVINAYDAEKYRMANAPYSSRYFASEADEVQYIQWLRKKLDPGFQQVIDAYDAAMDRQVIEQGIPVFKANQEFDDEIQFTERLEVPECVMAELRAYLLASESDIAFSIEDRGVLKRVFEHFLGRPPEG